MGNEEPSSTRLRCRRAKQLVALAQEEMVRHPCDVIANDSMTRPALGQICVVLGHPLGMFEKESEQIIKGSHGPARGRQQSPDRNRRATSRNASGWRFQQQHPAKIPRVSFPLVAHVLEGFHSTRFQLPARVLDQISREMVEDAFEHVVKFQLARAARVAPIHVLIGRIEGGDF